MSNDIEIPRLKKKYREQIVPALQEEFKYANVMQIPGLTKIVVNMGVGEAARDSKIIDGAVRDLTVITGQKPTITRARKSIAQFKLREGMPIGCHVTLRGNRMWEFADRLLTLALAIVLRFVVEWLLALAAFWMVRTDGLNSLYFAVVTLLSGAFAPLDRLPGWMRTTSELTPFPYFLGYPLEIFTARATPGNGLHVIVVQLAMILVFGALGRLTYKRAIRCYEGVSS